MKSILLTAVVTALLATVSMAQVPAYVPSNGLVGWWPFNGNANDESGNGNNGTVNGAILAEDRFGNLDCSYSFNGNESIALGKAQTIFGLNPDSWSVSVWYRPDELNNGEFYAVVSDYNSPVTGEDPTVTFQIELRGDDNNQHCFTRYNNNTYEIWDGISRPVAEWWHTAVVFSKTNQSIDLYENGEFITSTYLDPNFNYFTDISADVMLGKRFAYHFNVWPFIGLIDDVGFWNRALTPCEISELYNARLIHITADAGLDESVCNGEALTLTATENSGITQTMNVTAASSSDYTFAGDYTGADPNITAEVGDTLVFNINSPSHPFWLKTAPVTGTGSAVAVANNGTGSGTISWIPDVAGTYYYICQFHSGMTGTITVLPSSTSISWNNGITNGVSFTPTNSGYYTATATNGGCSVSDSLFVTVNLPTSSSITASDCDSYIAPDGATYNSTGNYTAVIPNAVGCDSTISIDLTITNSTTGSETITECNSFTWGANNQTYTATGQYTAVLTNAVGCDSTVTLDLTITQPTTGSETITECNSFTWGANNQTYTATGQYTAVLTNAVGCDSTVTLDLTINTVDNGITQVDDFTLQANETGASYQWIDCTDGSIVVGATSQQFAPTENGDYAVVVTQNGCSDTTACLSVVSLSLLDNDKPMLTVYPNPAKETITISSDASIVGKDFSIINQLGQAVILGKIVQQEMSVDLSDLATGVYVIRIDGVEKSSFRIVKE